MTTALIITDIILNLLWWLIFAQFILSLLVAFNVMDVRGEPIASIWRAFEVLLDPIYAPIRRILPQTGSVDFAPMVVLVLMAIIDRALVQPALVRASIGA